MALVGASSVGLLLVVGRFVPTLADRPQVALANLDTARRSVSEQFLRDGSFPASLAAVQAGAGAIGDSWANDPYGAGSQLRYVTTPGGVTITSRGVDQRLGSADDVVSDIAAEPLLRVRQRLRLRMVRAVYVAELAAAITPSLPNAVQDAVRGFALAQRQWRTASNAERVALQATMDTCTTALGLLLATASYVVPTAVTGAGGFMSRLGLSDSRAVDGVGRSYALHPVLGVIAVGYDGVGGTDDDM